MTETLGTVVLCVLLALAIVAAFGKRKPITGFGLFTKDKKGRLVMILTPARKRKRKK